jgi:hypothetical protein
MCNNIKIKIMRLLKLTAVVATCSLVITITGCIKERGNNFVNETTPTPNTVDFNHQNETAALDIVAAPTIYKFYAELNSSYKAYPGTTVTIAKNLGLVSGAGADFLPDSAYQLVNNTATVDPATHVAEFQLKIFTSKIDLTKSFAVGYTINSVTGGAVIGTNKSTILIVIGAKNKWDGVYELKGYHNRDPYTFPYDVEESMITVNGTSDAFYWNDAGSVGHPIGTGPGAVSWYGASVAPVVVFDPATNLITNIYNSDPAGPPITMFTGPGSGVSRYVPGTKTIYAYWNYNGNPLRAFFDTLTYLRPRD